MLAIPLSLAAEKLPTVTGLDMAEHGKPQHSTAPGNDYAQHEGTYVDFLKLVKWVIIVVVVILAGMFFFLA